jgi:hypothetical protein
VDGLHNVEVFGDDALAEILTQLGDLAHWGGFIVVCGTLGPVETFLQSSPRHRYPWLV